MKYQVAKPRASAALILPGLPTPASCPASVRKPRGSGPRAGSQRDVLPQATSRPRMPLPLGQRSCFRIRRLSRVPNRGQGYELTPAVCPLAPAAPSQLTGVEMHVICKRRSSRRLHPNTDPGLPRRKAGHLCGWAFPAWLVCCVSGESEQSLTARRNAPRPPQPVLPFCWDGELSDAWAGIFTATSRSGTLNSH